MRGQSVTRTQRYHAQEGLQPASGLLLVMKEGLVLQGKLAATAVNAPMVPAEVLAELQPFVSLAQGLGRAAIQLVARQGFSDVRITYSSPRGDDLDTR